MALRYLQGTQPMDFGSGYQPLPLELMQQQLKQTDVRHAEAQGRIDDLTKYASEIQASPLDMDRKSQLLDEIYSEVDKLSSSERGLAYELPNVISTIRKYKADPFWNLAPQNLQKVQEYEKLKTAGGDRMLSIQEPQSVWDAETGKYRTDLSYDIRERNYDTYAKSIADALENTVIESKGVSDIDGMYKLDTRSGKFLVNYDKFITEAMVDDFLKVTPFQHEPEVKGKDLSVIRKAAREELETQIQKQLGGKSNIQYGQMPKEEDELDKKIKQLDFQNKLKKLKGESESNLQFVPVSDLAGINKVTGLPETNPEEYSWLNKLGDDLLKSGEGNAAVSKVVDKINKKKGFYHNEIANIAESLKKIYPSLKDKSNLEIYKQYLEKESLRQTINHSEFELNDDAYAVDNSDLYLKGYISNRNAYLNGEKIKDSDKTTLITDYTTGNNKDVKVKYKISFENPANPVLKTKLPNGDVLEVEPDNTTLKHLKPAHDLKQAIYNFDLKSPFDEIPTPYQQSIEGGNVINYSYNLLNTDDGLKILIAPKGLLQEILSTNKDLTPTEIYDSYKTNAFGELNDYIDEYSVNQVIDKSLNATLKSASKTKERE